MDNTLRSEHKSERTVTPRNNKGPMVPNARERRRQGARANTTSQEHSTNTRKPPCTDSSCSTPPEPCPQSFSRMPRGPALFQHEAERRRDETKEVDHIPRLHSPFPPLPRGSNASPQPRTVHAAPLLNHALIRSAGCPEGGHYFSLKPNE
jgi:hypothetical protein